jgi:regulator of nonsense transcripts 2
MTGDKKSKNAPSSSPAAAASGRGGGGGPPAATPDVKEAAANVVLDEAAPSNTAAELLRPAVDTLQQAVQQWEQRAAWRQRATNVAASRAEFERQKKNFKADVKKCTTFVKKIRSSSSGFDDSLIDYVTGTLNLSRYVEEIAVALLDSKFKVTDVLPVVQLCVALHERYAEFLPNLLPRLWAIVTGTTKDDDKVRRVYLRWVTELVVVGVVTETKPLSKLIAEVAGAKASGEAYVVQDAHLLVAFCRAASPHVFGIMPCSVQQAMELIQREAQLEAYESGGGTAGPDSGRYNCGK